MRTATKSKNNRNEKERKPKGPAWVELGKLLKTAREEAGLTASDVARELGTSLRNYTFIEEGKAIIEPHMLKWFAEKTNIDKKKLAKAFAALEKHVTKPVEKWEREIEEVKHKAEQGIISDAMRQVGVYEARKKGNESYERMHEFLELWNITLNKPLPVYPVRAGRYRIADGELLGYTWMPENANADGALLVEGDSLSGLGIKAGDLLFYRKDIEQIGRASCRERV